MVRKIYTLSLLTLIGVVMISTSARAQSVTGGFLLHAALDGGNVDLSWTAPEMFSIEYYLVYRAQVGITDSSLNASYSMIDSTTATEYTDTTAPPANTFFVYLVKAFNSTGQVRLSSLARVFVNPAFHDRDHVTITSVPSTNATVDSLYTYQVTAVSSDSTAVLQYRLGEHPPLMTIDSTGLVKWTPQMRGWYEVEVAVTSSKGGHASQEYGIRVAGTNGKIAGIVTDTLGNPIPHTVVRLYQRGMMPMMGVVTPIIDFFDYSAVTDSTGHYMIRHVDLGRYLVRATPTNPNYLPEWYDNVQNIMDATAITVSDTSTHVADFALRNRFANLPRFVISGSVKDTLGNPVKGAWVVFARAGFVFNEAREDQEEWEQDENFRDFFADAIHEIHEDHDFALDGHSPFVYRTYVDSTTGAYQDTLPEGNYIVFAKANGYYRTFYNNEHGLLNADILKLVSDTTGINFALIQYPPIALGDISGSVLDSLSGAGVAARLVAFRDIWNYRDTLRMHVAGVYFADADSTGAYDFQNLPPGYYKILALPLGSYAPSFYSMTGPTVRWKDATAVQVNGNSTSGINIFVMPLPDSASGFTSIAGMVTSSDNSAGVNGALVYAADGNGDIVGYGATDATGSYTISGLAPGSYNVFTDAVGYSSSSSSMSNPGYDGNGNPAPSMANFSVTPETPTAVQEKVVVPVNYSLEQNYPNPFNPTTQIAFSIPQPEHVTVTVFNILGQRMATLVDADFGTGSHIITWNAKNGEGELLPSGVYFYRLSTPNFTAVRKMLLLK